jgi:cell division transport system permease protein
MRIRTLIRHVREGARYVWRNGWMSFASISAMAVSMLVLGVFVITALNVNALTQNIENEIKIKVYLDIAYPRGQVPMVQNQIGSIPGVKRITFVSKEEELAQTRLRWGEEGKKLLQSQKKDPNPFPDAFVVEVYEPRNVDDVASRILGLNETNTPKPIWKLNYGADTIRKLFAVIDVVRYIGIGLIAALTIMSVFLIANTIKLTITARRSEIAIMKLVGATHTFIRWPFFIEGSLIGMIGALIPVLVLGVLYDRLLAYAETEIGFLREVLLPAHESMSLIAVFLLVLGQLIGLWGSVISIRKFLRV